MDPNVNIRVEKCHSYLASRIAAKGKPIYGVNTGFGALANTKIANDKLSEFHNKFSTDEQYLNRLLILQSKSSYI